MNITLQLSHVLLCVDGRADSHLKVRVRVTGGGGGLPGDNFDGIISEGENFAPPEFLKLQTHCYFLVRCRRSLLFLVVLRWLLLFLGGLWMVHQHEDCTTNK